MNHEAKVTGNSLPSRHNTHTILARIAKSGGQDSTLDDGNHQHRHTVQLAYQAKLGLAQASEDGEDREELQHT
jgi:hypothetical protein